MGRGVGGARAAMGSMVADRAGAVDARADELWSTVEEHHGHFTGVCAKLDSKFVDQMGRLDAQAEQEHAFVVETAASLDEKLSSSLQRLEEQPREKNATQDERTDELSGALAEHPAPFTACPLYTSDASHDPHAANPAGRPRLTNDTTDAD